MPPSKYDVRVISFDALAERYIAEISEVEVIPPLFDINSTPLFKRSDDKDSKLTSISPLVSNIYFTECCKCIIEDRKTLDKCSNNCMTILIEQLTSLPCDIILTMGLYTTQAILKTKIKKYADYVGKEFDIVLGDKKYRFIPIYHPSPLNPKGYKDNIPIFEKIKALY